MFSSAAVRAPTAPETATCASPEKWTTVATSEAIRRAMARYFMVLSCGWRRASDAMLSALNYEVKSTQHTEQKKPPGGGVVCDLVIVRTTA